MRKLFATATISGCILLAGCTAAPDAAEPTPTPTPKQATNQTPNEAYVTAYRATNPDATRATDEQWLELGQAACDALAAGASPGQVTGQMLQGDTLTADEAASAVLLATEHLCPAYAPQ